MCACFQSGRALGLLLVLITYDDVLQAPSLSLSRSPSTDSTTGGGSAARP